MIRGNCLSKGETPGKLGAAGIKSVYALGVLIYAVRSKISKNIPESIIYCVGLDFLAFCPSTLRINNFFYSSATLVFFGYYQVYNL